MDGEDLIKTIVDFDWIVNKVLDRLAQQAVAGFRFAGKAHEDRFVRMSEVEQVTPGVFATEANVFKGVRFDPGNFIG